MMIIIIIVIICNWFYLCIGQSILISDLLSGKEIIQSVNRGQYNFGMRHNTAVSVVIRSKIGS